jgi:AcrR family transcriptional regulator
VAEVPRITQGQKELNREKIVRAAGEGFKVHGVDGIGIQELMKAAGMTNGGFYNHFPSKEELALEVYRQGFTDSLAALAAIRTAHPRSARAALHDMVDVYVQLLSEAPARIDGEIFNVGSENHTVLEIARIVQRCVGGGIPIEVVPTNDPRSYHVSSEKIRRQLGFQPQRSVEHAVRDLKAAFDAGRVSDPLNNPLYFNIKRMQETHAQ